MKTSLLTSLMTAGLVSAGAMLSSTPAEAFTFSGGDVLDITASDVGSSFDVNFDQGGGDFAANLKAKATFELVSFFNGLASFNISLKNTSTINSTLTALGFNTSPVLNSATGGGSFSDVDYGANFPNSLGNRVVCFFDGPGNCTGSNPNGGLAQGENETFLASLVFAPATDSFDLLDFAVRYQQVGPGQQGSGTAGGTAVPTPALLPGLIGMGVAALRKRKGEGEETSEA